LKINTDDGLPDPEKWLDVLPRRLYDGLVKWVAGQAFTVQHRRWLIDGRSGSFVALVRIRPERGHFRGAVLKLLPPAIAAEESRGTALSEQHSPEPFRNAHLVRTTLRDPLPGADGWWLHLQEAAPVDLGVVRPLRHLIDDPLFASYCDVIVRSVVLDWNPGYDPPALRSTPGEFLTAFVEKQRAGIAAFAAAADPAAGMESPLVRIPGRPDPLPNPLLLLDNGIPGAGSPLEIFLGNGHGDLHPGNIFVPVDDGVRADAFRLIDSGRFDNRMPVSRDPVKMLLGTAAAWLASLAGASALRSSLAELVVAPAGYPASAPIAGYLQVSRAIHAGAAQWGIERAIQAEWQRQHLLTIIGSALRTVADDEMTPADRWWHFEVAAVATEVFRSDNLISLSTTTAPSTARTPEDKAAGRVPTAEPALPVLDDRRSRFVHRLGGQWRDLCAALDIPDLERAVFPPGLGGEAVWEWLQHQDRIDRLPAALRAIGRADIIASLDRPQGET
jgi:hypothetical protein